MPIQIIDQPNWGNSLLALLGGGAEGFIQGRKEKQQRQRLEQSYEKSNLPSSYANLDPSVVRELIKQQGSQQLAMQQGNIQTLTGPEGQESQRLVSPVEQKEINGRYKPFIDGLRNKQPIFKEIEKLTKESEELLKSGEIFNASGWLGGIKSAVMPKSAQNAKTRKYLSNIERLIALQTQVQGGRITDAAREQIKASKPSVDQPIETQLALLKDIREPAVRGIVENDAIHKLIRKNNNRIPDNLDVEVESYLSSLEEKEPLGDPSQEPVGIVREDDNGQPVINTGSQWLPAMEVNGKWVAGSPIRQRM